MDDHELARLRQTIERIEDMSAEEKAQLCPRINAIHQMPPEEVQAMRRNLKNIPREKREVMRDRWVEMSLEKREQLRSKLRKKGFLPPPTKHHGEASEQESSDPETIESNSTD